MDKIDEVLATNALSAKYSASIHAALSVGKKTLNRYYEKTDLSSIYRIAMSMCSFLESLCILTFNNCSSPSSSQAYVFQKSKVGERLDRRCQAPCTNGI
jgi:hypothetical protein